MSQDHGYSDWYLHEYSSRFGDRLRTERQHRGLTQDEAARRFGVTSKTWGRWEREEAVPSSARIGLLRRKWRLTDVVWRRGDDLHGIVYALAEKVQVLESRLDEFERNGVAKPPGRVASSPRETGQVNGA